MERYTIVTINGEKEIDEDVSIYIQGLQNENDKLKKETNSLNLKIIELNFKLSSSVFRRVFFKYPNNNYATNINEGSIKQREMERYTIVTTGQKSNTTRSTYVNRNMNEVLLFLDRYWDEDYPKPEFNGESFELNGDLYITITKQTNTIKEKVLAVLNEYSYGCDKDGYPCICDNLFSEVADKIIQIKETP